MPWRCRPCSTASAIAAAQTLYVTDALEAGRLVAPFPIVATKAEAWYLEYRPSRADDPALIAFRDWLHGEAERQRQIEAELVKRPVGSQAGKIRAAAVV